MGLESLLFAMETQNTAAARLRLARNEIVEAWIAEVKRAIYPARLQIQPALVDSLPVVLNRMSAALERKQDQGDPIEDEQVLAELHGTQRARLEGYTLADVLGEYHILRKVIFDRLESTTPLEPGERDLILDLLQKVIRSSTLSFSKQREHDLAATKDHYSRLQALWHPGRSLVFGLMAAAAGTWLYGVVPGHRLLFIPMAFCLVVGLYCGIRAGVLAIAASAISIAYLYMAPDTSVWIAATTDRTTMLLYIGFGIAGCALAGNQRLRFIQGKSTEAFLKAAQVDQEKRMIERQEHILDLERETELREKFVAMLTHDLRNPLTAAKACSQMIGRLPESPDRANQLAGRITDSLERANRMIEDLLDVNLIHGGQPLHLSFGPCDLRPIVNGVLNDYRAAYGDRFVAELRGDLKGTWSSDGLRRVLENLVVNAVKYGDPKKPITVSADDLSDSVVIAVHNHGNPLSPEEQDKLFRSLHRLDSAKHSGQKGWGLGLTLVKGITDAHHGTVSVESGKEGTRFSVHLPKSIELQSSDAGTEVS